MRSATSPRAIQTGVVGCAPDDDRVLRRAANGADAEVLSALVPNVIQAADQLGQHAGRGGMAMGVLEFSAGYAIIANLSDQAKLLVVARPRTNIGPLLYDLTRHRAEIAGLL